MASLKLHEHFPTFNLKILFKNHTKDNIDFENLTNQIHSAWMGYGSEIGTHYFTKANLAVVFQKVGIAEKIAGKVAEEVFEKTPANAINLKQFIALIHGPNSDIEFDFDLTNDLCYENDGNTNSLSTLVDESERDFLFKGKRFLTFWNQLRWRVASPASLLPHTIMHFYVKCRFSFYRLVYLHFSHYLSFCI